MDAVQPIPVGEIHPSPTNSRRGTLDVKDLVDSVRSAGILQPLLLRPRPEGLEIVFGHRRYKAALEVGLETVPAMVRDMGDEEVLEAQIIENYQRADIHPMEEAESFERLRKQHGMTPEDIAAKIGRGRPYVYQRMQLLKLAPPVRKAFYAGELNAARAFLIARIPSVKLQVEALKEVGGEGVTTAEARADIQRQFMLALKTAPFDPKSAELLPAAGACTTCPKRTGNQEDLFGDLKDKELCTEPSCFQKKVDADWKLRAAAAREAGQEVIDEPKKLKKIFRWHGDHVDHTCGLLDPGDEAYIGGKWQKYKTALKKDLPPTVLVRTPSGRPMELVPKAAMQRALKAAGLKEGFSSGPGAYELKRREQLKRDAAVAKAIMEDLVIKAEVRMVGASDALKDRELDWLIDALFAGVVHRAWHDVCRDLVAGRGWAQKGVNPEKRILDEAKQMTPAQRLALTLEILARSDGGQEVGGFGKRARTLICDALGVKREAIAKQVTAELAAKKKTRAKKKAEAKKTSRPKAPPRRKTVKKKAGRAAK